jgi:flagellar hook-length control protein FliK
MKASAIATNGVRIQKGGMAILMKALDKISTETPHSSQNVSFAGILNRKKEIASAPAPIFNKKNQTTNDPDKTAVPIGKPVTADTSPKAKQTIGLTVLSPSKDIKATPADSQKTPVSTLTDETSFPAFANTAFTKAPNPATPAPVIALDLQEGPFASTPAATEGESPFVQAMPDGRISLPSGKIWLDISLQGEINPDNRISSETMPAEDHDPVAGNILNEETAFPGKASGPDQILKQCFTSTLAMIENSEPAAKPPLTSAPIKTEKADMAIMNKAAFQKDEPVTTGKVADSKQTARHALTSALVKTEKADVAIMNPAALQKDGPVTTGKAADSEQTAKYSLTSAPVKIEMADAAIMNPATVVHSERDLASKSVFSGRAESTVELPDRAVAMKEGATATGHDANIDKNRTLTLARTANPTELESFPFRVESLGTASSPEAKAPLSDASAGSRTQAIINQILDAKQAMNGDFGRIRIVLSPPNLGTVDLEIVVRNERVEVVMTADNSRVQQTLQSSADDIRNAMQRHDLKIESFQVLLQDQDASQHKSSGGAQFEQRRENQATHDFRDSSAITIPSPTPAVSSMQASGPEEGRVSIFI